jgi:hypothetical protein
MVPYVHIVMAMKTAISCDVVSCSLVNICESFGGTCSLRIDDGRARFQRNSPVIPYINQDMLRHRPGDEERTIKFL